MLQQIIWMPSHLKDHQAGTRKMSNGQLADLPEIRGNQAADALAKAGASSARVADGLRKNISEHHEKVRWLAVVLGHLTLAANSLQGPCKRDSAPPKPRRVARERRPRRKPAKQVTTARPASLGGHRLTPIGCRWKCTVCSAGPRCWRRLAPGRCEGPAVRKWLDRAVALAHAAPQLRDGFRGRGHILFLSDSTVWCDLCGCSAEHWAVGLARPCNGRPSSAGMAQILRYLRQGKHPRTHRPFRLGPFPELADSARTAPLPPLHFAAHGWHASVEERQHDRSRDGRPAGATAAAKKLVALAARIKCRIAARPSARLNVAPSCTQPRQQPGDRQEEQQVLDHSSRVHCDDQRLGRSWPSNGHSRVGIDSRAARPVLAERKSRRIDSQASAVSPREFTGCHEELLWASVAPIASDISLKRRASNVAWGDPELGNGDEHALRRCKRRCLVDRLLSASVPSRPHGSTELCDSTPRRNGLCMGSLPGAMERSEGDPVAIVAASAKRKASASPPRLGGSACGERLRALRPGSVDLVASSRRFGVMGARRRLVRDLGGD